MDRKQDLVSKLEKIKNNNPHNIFHKRAYQIVINEIKLLKSVSSLDDLKNVYGIGKKIYAQLEEYFYTGDIRCEIEDDLFSKLLLIYGVGYKKADELIKKYKIKSLNDLRNKVKENKNILNENQYIGLLYYDDLNERIPRSEMLLHQEILDIPKDKGQIVGSFRRGKNDSGDIDVMLLVSEDEFHSYISYLEKIGYLKHKLAYGSKKMLGICKVKEKYRRIDIIRTTEQSHPFMLLYFTGSEEFNVNIRKHALKNGYSLNEYGFTPSVDGIKKEKDIFKFLKLKYITPEER